MIKGKLMTEGKPYKHIISFALPVLLGSLLQQLYNTVDTIIVGRFSGEAALSAVGTTGSFLSLFLALAVGFSSGNCVLVAQHYGAKDEKKVRESASTGIILLFTMGLLTTVVALLVARVSFKYLVNVPDKLMELTLSYFRIYALGLIFQFGYNIFSSILRALGDSAATLYFLLIASIMNIGLDLLFVAVFGLGVRGAAIATVISQLASFIAAYLYMTIKYPIFRFKIKELKWFKDSAKKTISIGFPIVLQMSIISFGLTFIQRAVNGFGEAMIASFTVGQRIEMYLNLPSSAFQTTLATYTGQNIGAKRIDRVRRGVRETMIISLILTLLISGCVFLFASQIVTFFSLGSLSAEYCVSHLRTVAFINIILSLYMPLFGVFQATGHSIVPAFVATGALTMRVLVTYLFRYSSFLGYKIIWWNGLFGFGMGFIICWSYYLSGKWRKNSSVTELEEV